MLKHAFFDSLLTVFIYVCSHRMNIATLSNNSYSTTFQLPIPSEITVDDGHYLEQIRCDGDPGKLAGRTEASKHFKMARFQHGTASV